MPGEAHDRALVLSEVAASAVSAPRSRNIPYVSLGIIAVFVLLALLAPFLRLADPHDQSLRNRFRPPVWEEGGSWKHALGTDRLGRDMLSRIVWGSRVSLAAGVVTVLVEFIAGRLQWLPAAGNDGFASYILPGFTLGWFVVAGMMRLLRSAMLEVLDSEYVKLARVKGVVESKVIWIHALKNALIPVVTFAGIYFSILVTTAIVVETVFAWPGLGRLAYEGISSRDFPVIQAVVLTTAAIVTVVNLGVDCLYAIIDPRIRYAR